MLKSTITMDGSKAAVVCVSGYVDKPIIERVVDFLTLKDCSRGVRIDSIVYSFVDKFRGYLHWEDKDDTFILPLEGRGRLEFESLQSLHSPKESKGILMKIPDLGEGLYPKALFVVMDMVKS